MTHIEKLKLDIKDLRKMVIERQNSSVYEIEEMQILYHSLSRMILNSVYLNENRPQLFVEDYKEFMFTAIDNILITLQKHDFHPLKHLFLNLKDLTGLVCHELMKKMKP